MGNFIAGDSTKGPISGSAEFDSNSLEAMTELPHYTVFLYPRRESVGSFGRDHLDQRNWNPSALKQ